MKNPLDITNPSVDDENPNRTRVSMEGSGTEASEVQGSTAEGAAPTGNPIVTAGEDPSGNVKNTAVDADGNTQVVEQYAPAYEDNDAGVAKVEQRGTYAYVAAPGADNVIKASPGFLYGIIIGADVTASTIEVSDHASDGDGNVKIFLTGDTLMTSTGGYVPVNASFGTGITADIAAQTNVTFIYR